MKSAHVYDDGTNASTSGASLEYKRFSVRFVLATLLALHAPAAYADDLLPPPPPPPGTSPQPPSPAPIGSGVLDAPPPPPPGVNIEPAPAPTSTPTVPKPPPTVLAPPPTPPPGANVTPPKRETERVARPAQTSDQPPSPNTLPGYRPPVQPRQTIRGKWYGWKSALGLVPVYGLFAAGIATDEPTIFIPAAIGGLLVTPIAHWTHGNRGRGWLSFGLNLGAPTLGLFVGGGYGALIGLGVWNFVDVVALHYEQIPVAPPRGTASIVQSWAIVPMMDHGRRGITLVGQF